MKFLSMVRVQENGQLPSERLMNEMGKLIDELIRSGKLVRTAGLRPSSEGVRVRSRYGKVSTVDGPFAETKEVVGGYAIFDVDSKDEALALTRRFLEVHADEWDVECELRELDSPEFCAGA